MAAGKKMHVTPPLSAKEKEADAKKYLQEMKDDILRTDWKVGLFGGEKIGSVSVPAHVKKIYDVIEKALTTPASQPGFAGYSQALFEVASLGLEAAYSSGTNRAPATQAYYDQFRFNNSAFLPLFDEKNFMTFWNLELSHMQRFLEKVKKDEDPDEALLAHKKIYDHFQAGFWLSNACILRTQNILNDMKAVGKLKNETIHFLLNTLIRISEATTLDEKKLYLDDFMMVLKGEVIAIQNAEKNVNKKVKELSENFKQIEMALNAYSMMQSEVGQTLDQRVNNFYAKAFSMVTAKATSLFFDFSLSPIVEDIAAAGINSIQTIQELQTYNYTHEEYQSPQSKARLQQTKEYLLKQLKGEGPDFVVATGSVVAMFVFPPLMLHIAAAKLNAQLGELVSDYLVENVLFDKAKKRMDEHQAERDQLFKVKPAGSTAQTIGLMQIPGKALVAPANKVTSVEPASVPLPNLQQPALDVPSPAPANRPKRG